VSLPTITRYGEWVSPISAKHLTAAARRLNFPTPVGDEVWWNEDRPAEAGRTTVMARRADGEVVSLLPPPWSVRSRVHEYGGRSFLPVPTAAGPALAFVNFTDQRLYRLDPGAVTPVPLTPAPVTPGGLRYVDLQLGPDQATIWCVRERHDGDEVTRHVVAVPIDGRAADTPSAVVEVVSGSRFLAHPRLSPDGRRLAWVAWDHPRMPWDGTELRVGELHHDGTVRQWRTVLGGESESVLQPEWDGDDHLFVVSDRDGWWNLYRVPAAGGSPAPLHRAEEEFGYPLWQLGLTTYGRLADGRLLCIHGTGTQRLGVLDPTTGHLSDLDLPYRTLSANLTVDGDVATLVAGDPARPTAIILVRPNTGQWEVVRPAVDPESLPDPSYLPVPESTTLTAPDGRDVHVHIYPPRNPDHTAPDGELPPYVVFVHGGPTAQSTPVLDLTKAFFTSRGIGVLDVNYGGSTGYGRAYRQRLDGAWGEVDVDDCVVAARALVTRGDADPARLAIRGGSAGGWTTLCAVTTTDVFAAATSLYGVTDAGRLAETTHDFESRYVANLVGPDGEARSPIHRADQARCPVLLLQGADDPVVPPDQAEAFRDALAAKGVPHALVVFPNEAHGFRRAETIQAAAEAELSFYGQVMGFEPPGIPRLDLVR